MDVDTVFVKTRNDVSLRSYDGKSLGIIPKSTRVAALGIEDGYWKVLFNGQVGLVNNLDIVANPQEKERAEQWLRNLQLAANRKKQVQQDAQAKVLLERRNALRNARTELIGDKRWIGSNAANVRAEPDAKASLINQLSLDTAIYVQEISGEWLRVAFHGPFGVIPDASSYATVDDYLKDFSFGWIHSSLASNRDPIERGIEARRNDYVARHPELDSRARAAIISGTVVLGMTSDAVSASMGAPRDVNRSVGSWGIHEQWVYPGKYLYFENGVLTSWQD